jgi:4-amino-4-deoxy-L-arabinose transferase-like glycosyltransferase
METVLGLASLAALLFFCSLVSRIGRGHGLPARAIAFFLAGGALVPSLGHLLSRGGLLASIPAWTLSSLAAALLLLAPTLAVPSLRRLAWGRSSPPAPRRRSWRKELPAFPKALLGFLLLAVLVSALLSLALVLFAAPHIWDNMVTRLPRVAYWIQHGNYDYYDANMYTQVLAQKNFELILLWVFLVSGLHENLTGLPQFASYLMGMAMVYGIARRLGRPRPAALFAGLVFALLPQVVLQSYTANSDLFLAACLGAAVYSLLSFRATGRRGWLWTAGMAFALAAGAKVSVLLAAPSLLLIGIFSFFARLVPFRARLGGAFRLAAITAAALAVLALPAGYVENWRIFGHPIGDKNFRTINLAEGKGPAPALRNGMKHLIAMGFDFLALDGLPPVPAVAGAQKALHFLPASALRAAGWNLDSDPSDNWYYDKPWHPGKPPVSHPDYSLWGVFGFVLVWPAVFASLFGRRRPSSARFLALAALVFVLVHALSGASWGHYTLYATVFAVPLVGFLFPPSRLLPRIGLAFIAALGVVSSVAGLLFQLRSPILFDQAVWLRNCLSPQWEEVIPLPTRTDSVFARDRLGQLLRDGPVFEDAIRKFEELVPPGAVVAACLNWHSYEYPLFGRSLTRTILPINSFWRGLQPIPLTPQPWYLLWADDFNGIFNPGEGDVHLGKDWYLRDLCRDRAISYAEGREVVRHRPALASAVYFERVPAVSDLLAAGADPNGPGFEKTGDGPLILAVKGGQAGIIGDLLAAGAAPDVRDRRGRTPLMYAASYNQGAAACQLLRAGADPDACDAEGLSVDRWLALAGSNREKIRAALAAARSGRRP